MEVTLNLLMSRGSKAMEEGKKGGKEKGRGDGEKREYLVLASEKQIQR